jgi:SAM-dependent methyltransferase
MTVVADRRCRKLKLRVLAEPQTLSSLELKPEADALRCDRSGREYPVVDEIVDLTGYDDRRESAYESLSGLYDGFLGSGSPLEKIYNLVVWGFNDEAYVRPLLDLYPNPAGLNCLDIPVGTGHFTKNLYSDFPESASLSVMDYSPGMLVEAKGRFRESGISNVNFVRADVGNIPMLTESVDIVLTMNGMHAFPDKPRALEEFYRVLKPGGVILGCFYVSGQRRITDLIVRRFYNNRGWFSPPHFTFEEYGRLLESYFDLDICRHRGSILWFHGTRKSSGRRSGNRLQHRNQ